MSDGGGLDELRCSARACRAAATHDLEWRNPSLHDAARRKHWLACDEHVDALSGFLARRGFLLGRGAVGHGAAAGPGVVTDSCGP